MFFSGKLQADKHVLVFDENLVENGVTEYAPLLLRDFALEVFLPVGVVFVLHA